MKFTLLCLFFFSSCTKWHELFTPVGRGPDEILKSFLHLSAGVKGAEDKKKLEGMCSGELRRAFERMSDEMFKLSYQNSQIEIKDLKFTENEVKGDGARLVYRVSIDNRQGTELTHETAEREVEMIRIQGTWFLDSIRARGSDQIAFTRGIIF